MSAKADMVITSSGAEIADETLEEMAEAWEDDTWEGRLTAITAGRPRIFDEELVNVTFRIQKSRLETIETIAKRKGETRSEYLREAVTRALVADAR